MEPVTTTVTPVPAAKTTVTAEPTKIAGSVITANTTKNTDKTAQDILICTPFTGHSVKGVFS